MQERKAHLERAHTLWKNVLHSNDTVIDATCGNGHDTLTLAKIVLEGRVLSLDIQQAAINSAKQLVDASNVTFINQSHEHFPDGLFPKLVVYNLGYLPGGDKKITTLVQTTLNSVLNALKIIPSQGAVSIMCYPGHAEGALEKEALLAFCQKLCPNEFDVLTENFGITRPFLIFITKK